MIKYNQVVGSWKIQSTTNFFFHLIKGYLNQEIKSKTDMTTGGSLRKKFYMKVGITFSTFDLLHAGHLKMLEEAKRQCDYLIVGLQLDPSIDRPEKKNHPSQSIIERYIQLKGSKHVDEIVPYMSEQDLEDILRSFKLDVRIIGEEYKEKPFTGKAYCEEKGIEIYYNSRDHRFSFTELRKQVKNFSDK